MILFNLMGGLGNQLFQYAAARQLSIKYKSKLAYDSSKYRKYTKNLNHKPKLHCFSLKTKAARSKDVLFLKYVLRNVYKEPMNNLLKDEYFKLKNNTYLQGYFLSYKYFHNIKDNLLTEIRPCISLSNYSRQKISEINSTESVALHVRRDDYLDDGNKSIINNITNFNYYQNAIAYLKSFNFEPKVFVFSDDIDWVSKNILIDGADYIKNHSENPEIEDFWMMRCCKHNILAGGSTFSWWSAYLGNNENKIVIHPPRLADNLRLNNLNDYFLKEWHPLN